MRRLAATALLALVASAGAVVAAVPVAAGDGQAESCQSSTSSTQSSTTTSTTTTTTSSTTSATPTITLPPPHGHPLNAVVVENCADGTINARSKLQTGVASAEQADPGNYAYAYAHDCNTGCDAIAVAFQVALVPQTASTQTPHNVAIAINNNCDHCGAFAFAYQYVVDVPPGTRLSVTTRRQIAAIRRQAAADVHANLTFVELDTRLKMLATQLRADVDAGLQKQHRTERRRRSSEHLKEMGHR